MDPDKQEWGYAPGNFNSFSRVNLLAVLLFFTDHPIMNNFFSSMGLY
jgi:hypothetical protein